jgi:hypothetical protein
MKTTFKYTPACFLLVPLLVGLLAVESRAQDLGRMLEDFGRQFIEPPREEPPDTDNRPRSHSVPGESGRENQGGRFRNGGIWGTYPDSRRTDTPRFVDPQPQRRTVVPSPPVRQPQYSNLPITIRCPDTEEGSLSYTILSERGNYPFTIRPGQKQQFKESRRWLIRYDSGGAGVKTYGLSGGREYKLVRTSEGHWQLYQQPDSAPDPPVASD